MRTRNTGVIIAAAALVLGAAIAGAAPRDGGCMRQAGMHGPGMRGAGMGGPGMHGTLAPIGRALHQIDLTAEQQTQIDTVFEEARPALHALHEQLRASEQAFRAANPITTFDEPAIRTHVAARAAIQADIEVSAAKVRTKVVGLLNAEQLTKLQQILAEDRDRPGPGGPPPGW